MTPKLVNEGRDPQLEEGVKQALELLKTQEVKWVAAVGGSGAGEAG